MQPRAHWSRAVETDVDGSERWVGGEHGGCLVPRGFRASKRRSQAGSAHESTQWHPVTMVRHLGTENVHARKGRDQWRERVNGEDKVGASAMDLLRPVSIQLFFPLQNVDDSKASYMSSPRSPKSSGPLCVISFRHNQICYERNRYVFEHPMMMLSLCRTEGCKIVALNRNNVGKRATEL